ncbi:S8 family serine peptidase [Cytophagales bacterium LB-30]|uniref:S8 family serine peptidase n=1 Tax=Shiella aurantiaca TaxID=3058365 RepID=A0ABT8F9F0_9BACT|nr:S8 family serine peptidase [Shiella aurantiaca]MDN4166581.1 S8 family serine peptidase [Shiella aurantiaca]
MRKFFFLLVFLFGWSYMFSAQAQDFSPDQVIVKLKPETERGKRNLDLQQWSREKKSTARLTLPQAQKSAYLSNIYTLQIPEESDILSYIKELESYDNVLYAEPYYLPQLLYVPNDPAAQNGTQDYLQVIKAYDAWSLSKGDPSIIIGILDSGTKLDHEDLMENQYLNTQDPVNGIDDDQDGYIDNYLGWDWADGDNNPSPGNSGHGTFVAGVSSASADNRKGMAGTGFNSSYMPLKIFRSSTGTFNKGYEAIVYAADQGCKVINLSWGAAGNYSQFAQDVINYAVLEKDVVVVAAAGNTHAELDFYPASYDHVLSVGATYTNDILAGWATYSHKIDLVAPGHQVYSTNWTNTYSKDNGTSFSAPMVAGAAALLRARFPNLNALQIMERLRVTSDPSIYQIPENQAFLEKMGFGRLDMARAISEDGVVSVRAFDIRYTNGYGQYALANDTLRIEASITNYLSAVQNLKVTLQSTSPYVHIVQESISIPSLRTLESRSLEDSPWLVVLDANTPLGEKIDFRIDFSAPGYSDFQYFSVFTTSEEAIYQAGGLSFYHTAANDWGGQEIQNSRGLYWKDKKIARSGGLVLSHSDGMVAHNLPLSANSDIRSADFTATQNIRFDPQHTAKQVLSHRFGTGQNIEITQNIIHPELSTSGETVIIDYFLGNTDNTSLSNVRIAQFMDVAIGNESQNKIIYDPTRKMAYAIGINNGPIYTALALLSSQELTQHALDLGNFNGNTADLSGEFTDALLFEWLNSNSKSQAGQAGLGNNVALLFGGVIGTIPAKGHSEMSLAWLTASSIEELNALHQQVTDAYQVYKNTPPTSYVLTVCPGDEVIIDPPMGDLYNFYQAGSGTLLSNSDKLAMGILERDTLVYIRNTDRGYAGPMETIEVRVRPEQTLFSLSESLILYQSGTSAEVQLHDESTYASSWQWDFGNGYSSQVQHPKAYYSASGDYTIRLTTTSPWGCQDQYQATVQVRQRSERPQLSTQFSICKGESANLQASNTGLIRVYKEANLETLLYEGTSFTTDGLSTDTLFYVSNAEGSYESLPEVVQIKVYPLSPSFNLSPDTSAGANAAQVQLNNTSTDAVSFQWLINGTLFSEEDAPSFSLPNENTVTISLIAENEQGCNLQIDKTLTRGTLPAPQISDVQLCAGSSILLQPSGGQVFNFYEASTPPVLVHRGENFTVSPQTSQGYLISSADGLWEGERTEVQVTVITYQPSFSANTDPIDLNFNNLLILESDNSEAASYQWTINGEIKSTSATLRYAFLMPESISVSLEEKNAEGCVGHVSQQFTAEYLLSSGEEVDKEGFILYPNPASDYIFIETQLAGDAHFEVWSAQGQRVAVGVLSPALQLIPCSSWAAGLYSLQIVQGDKVWIKKIQISP